MIITFKYELIRCECIITLLYAFYQLSLQSKPLLISAALMNKYIVLKEFLNPRRIFQMHIILTKKKLVKSVTCLDTHGRNIMR